MASNPWVQAQGPFGIVDGTAQTAAAAAEISPRPPKIFGPNYFAEPGSIYGFDAFGRLTTASTPGTWTFGLYFNTSDTFSTTTAVITSAAIAAKASQVNITWRFSGRLQLRQVGSGTAANIIGFGEILNVSSNGTDLAPATAPAAVNFDSTVTQFVKLGITPSVATGSITCHYFDFRSLN